jgi:hypothetical protein
MVVALTALFVGMGGTTWAVTKLPKRSVGSIQLKKGAVHKENIAAKAVTASKLAKSLVSSAPAGASGPSAPIIVNEDIPSDAVPYATRAGWADKADKADRATLADQATTATTATTAGTAGSATSAGSAANADALDGLDSSNFLPRSTIVDLPHFEMTGGQDPVTILAHGPLTWKATCDIGSGGTDTAEILISTTENHAAFDGDLITPDLLKSSPATDRIYAQVETPTGKPVFKGEDDGTAVTAGGAEVGSTVWYVGINILGRPGVCSFGGFAIL